MNVFRSAALLALVTLTANASAQADTGCKDASRLVWLLSADGRLWTLHPELLALANRGQPNCQVSAGSRATSLAIAQDGELWLAFSGGEIAQVTPSTLACRVSKERRPGIESLGVRPLLDGGDIVAVVNGESGRVLARFEPSTGALSAEVPLEGGGPVAFAADGQLWRLSTGVVPELWQMSIDGRIHRRMTLSTLRGSSTSSALVMVGDTPWVLLNHAFAESSSAVWQVDPLSRETRALLADTGQRFIAAGSVPSCVAPVEGACETNGRIVSPTEDEVLFGWKAFDVVVDGDATHVRVDAAGLSSLVEVQDAKDKRFARVSIPSTERDLPLRLTAVDAKERRCGEPVNAVRAKLALAARVKVPEHVVSETSWPVEATLQLAGADTVSRTFLDSNRLSARAIVQDQRVSLSQEEDGVWRGEAEGLHAGIHDVVVRWEAVGLAVESMARVRVSDPATVTSPASVALGAITAGTRWQDTCVSVPVSTRGLGGGLLHMTAAVPDGCVGVPVTSVDGAPIALSEGVEFKARSTMSVPVCLQSVACAGDESREIKISFSSDRLPEDTSTSVSWSVVGSSDWQCQRTRWAGLGASVLFALIFLGFVAPRRFERTDALRTASQREALNDAPLRLLRSFKGGKRGWYRNARFGLDPSGQTIRRHDPAVVFVDSGRRHVRLVAGEAPLRRFNPKTHRLEPIPDTVVERGVVYEAGGLWLTFE